MPQLALLRDESAGVKVLEDDVNIVHGTQQNFANDPIQCNLNYETFDYYRSSDDAENMITDREAQEQTNSLYQKLSNKYC